MLNEWNQRFTSIVKRADNNSDLEALSRSFHDAGFVIPLITIEDAIVYGRRGAGKTHLMAYLGHEKLAQSGVVIRTDLRSVGSSYSGYQADFSPSDGATRLLRDFLQVIHQSLLDHLLVVDNPSKFAVDSLDRFLEAANSFSIEESGGTFEHESTRSVEQNNSWTAGVASHGEMSFVAQAGDAAQVGDRTLVRTTSFPDLRLSFPGIQASLTAALKELQVDRLWILIDEWTSISPELQPYLADMIRRTLQPITAVSIKIFAVEQRAQFISSTNRAFGRVGIEVGADIVTVVNLDEAMVFDSSREHSQDFFREMLWRHVVNDGGGSARNCSDSEHMIRDSFKDARAFRELVRSCEGVPRDFLAILQKAAMAAGDDKISVDNVRDAARLFYQQDKYKNMMSDSELEAFMDWIVREVIGTRKSTAFMVRAGEAHDDLLQRAYDARLIHLVKRSYSSRHEPGVRYSVFHVDYGTYVDFIRTSAEPEQLSFDQMYEGVASEAVGKGGEEVPEQDLRSVRNCILRLEEFRRLYQGN